MSGPKKILFISFLTLITSVLSSAQIMQNEVEYNLASGVFDGTNLLIPTNLYSASISYPDAKALRVKFNSVNLGRNSFIVVRSLRDNLWQKLNSESIEQWYNITAYMNGESLEISLFVGPGDHGIFFNISSLIVENEPIQTDDLCGSDNRTPSNNKAIGRIVKSNYDPTGTGWILFDGRIVSAGHVLSGQSNLIIEFNVPDYYPGHPGPNDQYSINHNSAIVHDDGNNSTGDDWALMTVFPNSNTGLLPKEAQNAFFQVEQNTSTMTVRVTGYGIDDGSANYTQQTSTGQQTSVTGTTIWHSVDTRGVNSGSPIINESNGKAIGIHTDGGCLDPSLQSNFGTSFTNTSLWNEINPEINFTVHQKKNSGTELVGTYIGRWIGSQSSGSFQNYAVTVNGALIENLEYGDYETFRGKQEKTDDAPYEKFNTWSVENNPLEDVTNHQNFLIDYPMTELTSKFNLTYSGVTIKNEFLEIPGFNPQNDVVEFKDPWLIDYEDPMYNGTNYRNQGMPAPFKSRNSPFYPNYDSYYGADQYLGVFLGQEIAPDKSYYSIRSNSQQDIYLTQTGKTHRFYFQNWSESPSNSASFENPNSNETGVVFTSGSATVSSKYKGTQLSNQTNAYSNTSQRRFIQTPDGVKHICYESINKVWLEHSTDNGATWFLGNGGKPLSGADSKNPSMSFYGNQIGIVWQEKSGSLSNIKMAVFHSANYASSIFSTLVSNDCDFSTNANPVIAFSYLNSPNGNAVVIWSGLDMCVNPFGNTALKYWYGNASSNGISEISQCGIYGTDANSINPTITCNYLDTSSPTYFHFAWQQVINSSTSKINYCKLYSDQSGNLLNTTFEEASLNSGYSKNYNPLVVLKKVGTSSVYVYVSWLGYRSTQQEEALNKGNAVESGETRVLLKYKLGSSWSVTGVYGTSPVQNFSINKGTTFTNNQEPMALCWSEQSTYPFTTKLMKSPGSGILIVSNLTGKDMQINNGTNFSSMFANSFSSASLPYSFNLSQNFGSINKENSVQIFNGREGVVGSDGAQFYFALGDITANGQNINFISIPDTLNIVGLEALNNYFESEPFTINSSSSRTYGVQYGITDSALCSSVLSGNEQITFKVELLDNLTNEVLGVFDEVTYSEQNVYQYNNIGYQVNLSGIGSRTVKFRLVTNTNGGFGYSLSNRTADQNILAKGKYQTVNYQGNLAVTAYNLEQNYPNPFNPSTTIKFQIPQDGLVTFKVYDILGNEVTTLINEEKAKGRYEVIFNPSILASGVYIYKLQAGDFISSKKMILIK